MVMSTVNERLKAENQFLYAQVAQYRGIVGLLVDRLGGEQSVADADLKSMADDGAVFTMGVKPGEAKEDGTRGPDTLTLRVLKGEAAKAVQTEAPRIVAPQQSSLIIPGR
jgi:hypothetical protein